MEIFTDHHKLCLHSEAVGFTHKTMWFLNVGYMIYDNFGVVEANCLCKTQASARTGPICEQREQTDINQQLDSETIRHGALQIVEVTRTRDYNC